MGPRNDDDDEVNQERHEQVVERLDSLREKDEEAVVLLRSLLGEFSFLRSDILDLLVGRTPKGYVPIETYHVTIKTLIWVFGTLFLVILGLKELGLLKSVLGL